MGLWKKKYSLLNLNLIFVGAGLGALPRGFLLWAWTCEDMLYGGKRLKLKKKKEKKKKRKKRKKATILSVEATIVLAPKNQQAFKNYLLQCFQFLVSNKISSIQTDPK